MSITPRRLQDKHCFVPCPAERCDCRAGNPLEWVMQQAQLGITEECEMIQTPHQTAPKSALTTMKYRKKPAVIEAFQIGAVRFYPDWMHDAITAKIVITHAAPNSDGWREPFDNCDIATLEGVLHGQRGDWIIRGVKGELYPCKPDIFAMTYEPVDADAAIAAHVAQQVIGESPWMNQLFKPK